MDSEKLIEELKRLAVECADSSSVECKLTGVILHTVVASLYSGTAPELAGLAIAFGENEMLRINALLN